MSEVGCANMERRTDLNVAFIAGVLDARGHIDCQGRQRVRVTTRRHDLLEWLAKHTGTGVRVDNAGYQRRACSEHCEDKHQHIYRQSAYWNIDGARAVIVVWNALPYLVCQRTEAHQLLRATGTWQERTEITQAMARLGWQIPTEADMAVCRGETSRLRSVS